MDNEYDKTISFREDGTCNYCNDALERKKYTYFPNQEGTRQLENLLNDIKASGQGKKYDCLMGISGGLDSSYLAYLGKKWNLRALAIHIDDGFDTEISKTNLNKLVKTCGYDYKIITPDAEQFNALTKAYMKSGVPNIAVPQDNVLFAELYRCAKVYKTEYFLSGGNFSLESILSVQNTHSAYDLVNIRDIARLFCSTSIDKLHFISSTQRMMLKKLYKIKTVYPLNYVEYNRNIALKELNDFCGFQYYGSKHLENKLTAFIQLCWFAEKFNEDKRLAHYSSMIVSNQMTRSQALELLQEPLYNKDLMDAYISEIKSKLSIPDDEFYAIMTNPTHKHSEYRTENDCFLNKIFNLIAK